MKDDKPLILVVDDEKDLADNIAELLNLSDKYEAIVSYSGILALSILKKNKALFGSNKIKLVLLDIKMPEMSGLEFLEELRKQYHEEEIGVIMVTAWEDEEKWEKARLGGAAGYINKPVKENELLKAVGDFFAGKGKAMVEQTKWELLAKETKARADKKENLE